MSFKLIWEWEDDRIAQFDHKKVMYKHRMTIFEVANSYEYVLWSSFTLVTLGLGMDINSCFFQIILFLYIICLYKIVTYYVQKWFYC